jgi:hypothetical protein
MTKIISRVIVVFTIMAVLIIVLVRTFNFFNPWIGILASIISVLILLNAVNIIIDWVTNPLKEESKPKKKTKKPTK